MGTWSNVSARNWLAQVLLFACGESGACLSFPFPCAQSRLKSLHCASSAILDRGSNIQSWPLICFFIRPRVQCSCCMDRSSCTQYWLPVILGQLPHLQREIHSAR